METEEEAVEISEETFKKWLEFRLSPSTIRQYLSAFRGNIDNLTSQEGINTIIKEKVFDRGNNPFYKGFLKAYIECFELGFEIIKSRRKNQNLVKKEYKFLTKKQVDMIIKESNPWISILARVYFDTGLRLRELVDTKSKDINLDDRTIKGIGKGNKPFVVKFSSTTKGHLSKWLDQTSLEYPFHFSDRKIDWGKSFWYFLKKQCVALGIYGVHPHRFRHALGHHLRADKHFDLQQIKVKLRHSKLDTTEIYTTATQKEVDDKIDEEVFGDENDKEEEMDKA